MASKPDPLCPLCNSHLDEGTGLESHLLDDHTKEELAMAVVSRWEELQLDGSTR